MRGLLPKIAKLSPMPEEFSQLPKDYLPPVRREKPLPDNIDEIRAILNFDFRENPASETDGLNESGANSGQAIESGETAMIGDLIEMDFDQMESFPNHRFKLYTGERLQDMVDSIREYGILIPLIVWKREGKDKYTILSGHNRVNAGKIAGLTKGPVIIKENLSDRDASLIVTETNLRQRSFSDLSYSERAICLKQHYDIVKKQGKRNDLFEAGHSLVNPHEISENSTSLEKQTKLSSKENIGEQYDLSKDQITLYLRIALLS
ncbi:MAG: ParB N-terminal domain-containing protein, partial [Lachnospiraceae bacterium]|nr:ParB N-terminal domain-containing protein [Lachnospiraceae bacterium]